MAAAIVAARNGADVAVFERMSRVGKKLLATGNGRCNITNTNLTVDSYHGGSPRFILGILDQFGVGRTLSFFGELGIEPFVEENGYVYPASNQSSSVLDVLRYEMEMLGVEVLCDTGVDRVEKAGRAFRCHCTNSREYAVDRVVLAAGGKSSPSLGSNGSGFKIARKLGHTLKAPFPALVQIVLDSSWPKRLSGVRITARAECRMDGRFQSGAKGELLFTDYGISGIPALQISRAVSEHAGTDKNLSIHLDLFPDYSHGELVGLIAERIAHNPKKTLEMSFVGLLHKRLIPAILRESGFDSLCTPSGDLKRVETERIAFLLKNWIFRCGGVKSWMFSQVTAGGVDVGEVHSGTLESRIVPGLFFAGEILDVDGDCGGYNLQWAWASGYVAGINASLLKYSENGPLNGKSG